MTKMAEVNGKKLTSGPQLLIHDENDGNLNTD